MSVHVHTESNMCVYVCVCVFMHFEIVKLKTNITKPTFIIIIFNLVKDHQISACPYMSFSLWIVGIASILSRVIVCQGFSLTRYPLHLWTTFGP